jgi:hypothetical protein
MTYRHRICVAVRTPHPRAPMARGARAPHTGGVLVHAGWPGLPIAIGSPGLQIVSLSLYIYIYTHTHTAAALKCTCVHFMHRVHRPSPSPPYAARTSFHMRRDPSNTRPTSFPHQGACHLPAPPALAKRAPRGRMRRPT